MNPFLKTPTQLLIAYLLWSASGALFGFLLSHFYAINLLNSIFVNLLGMLILGVVSTSAYFVSANVQLTQQSFIVAFLLVSGASLFAGSLQILVYQILDIAYESLFDRGSFLAGAPGILLPIFVVNVVVYAFSLLVYDAMISNRALKGIEQQETARALWAKSAELKALRAQIDPHFLFNSLNSISALTSINPDKARAMVIELSQFYRESLTISDAALISVDKEIAICKHFIAIETIRYGDKLKLDIELDPQAVDCQLPPLCLQPLLENAIKHGIAQLKVADPINVKIAVQHNKLYVLVANDIPPEQSLVSRPEGTQIGLDNLRSRLALLFGDEAYCGWSATAGRFEVELIFPLSRGEQS